MFGLYLRYESFMMLILSFFEDKSNEFCTKSSSPCPSLLPIIKKFISFASDKRTTNDLKFSTTEKSASISITNMTHRLLPKAARKANEDILITVGSHH